MYFSSHKWDDPINIKDMFIDVDESVASYLPNYKINLIHPNLPDSELSKLKSELGIVLQFIKNSNDKNKLKESLENNTKYHKVSNISATLIKETTGLNFKISKEKENIDMCKAVNDLMEDSRKEGIKEGEFNALFKIIKQGLVTVEQAAKSIGLSKKQLLLGFKKYNLAL